jgi:hypothetical protein
MKLASEKALNGRGRLPKEGTSGVAGPSPVGSSHCSRDAVSGQAFSQADDDVISRVATTLLTIVTIPVTLPLAVVTFLIAELIEGGN